MKKWTVSLAALLLIAAAPVPKPVQAPDNALAVGTVIPTAHETVVGGWRQLYRGTYAKRIRQDRSVTESEECCFAVYEKGVGLLVLRTEPVARDARGEPLTERIVRSKWITRRQSESITDCQLLYLSPQLSLFDNNTEAIRSVVMDNGEFVIVSWRDPGSYCTFGD
jgi:hypothetical protein